MKKCKKKLSGNIKKILGKIKKKKKIRKYRKKYWEKSKKRNIWIKSKKRNIWLKSKKIEFEKKLEKNWGKLRKMIRMVKKKIKNL